MLVLVQLTAELNLKMNAVWIILMKLMTVVIGLADHGFAGLE